MNTFQFLFFVVFLVSARADTAYPYVKPAAFENRKSGLEMIFVKGGTFIMGGQDHVDDGGPKGGADIDECPHPVTIRDFSIGRYEVTQADWVAIMGSNPSFFQEHPECPVEQVSWNDIQEFIRRLNIKLKEKYRLPTEEEWEFAARGGLASKDYRYSGSNNPKEVAWYRENSGGKPHPVGRLKPNELGIYDMSGNIWEWCSDLKNPYPCDLLSKRLKFDSRVLRGGTWAHGINSIRVRDRNGRSADQRLRTLGFRLAK